MEIKLKTFQGKYLFHKGDKYKIRYLLLTNLSLRLISANRIPATFYLLACCQFHNADCQHDVVDYTNYILEFEYLIEQKLHKTSN